MGSTIDSMPREEVRVAPPNPDLISIAWIGLLLIACYAPILARLVDQWSHDEDMGHGFFVPVIAVYIAWQRKDELMAQPFKQNILGLFLMLFAAVQALAGTLGAEIFSQRTAFVLSVIGAVFYAGGTRALKILAFPLFLLFLMVPIPAVIYNEITFPLQLLASQVAETALSAAGIPVVRDGNILELPSQKLSVVEACSGIRSLISLSFLSLIYGYFMEKRTWLRVVLFLATVPIAITANASRVTLTGLLSEIDVEYSKGLYHSLSGWVVFVVAAVFLGVFHHLVLRLIPIFKRS